MGNNAHLLFPKADVRIEAVQLILCLAEMCKQIHYVPDVTNQISEQREYDRSM
jgi:hypothetical protein